MNKIVYNYKATVDNVVSGSTFDAVVNFGMQWYKKGRVRIAGVELPEYDRDGKQPQDEKELLEKAKQCLRATIEHRKIVVSPYRPKKHGQMVGDIYLPCRRENIHYPMITATYAGIRFLNVCLFMNLLAEKRFDDALHKEIFSTLDTYDF